MLGDRVARATLAREKSLNSLTLDMINQLSEKIEAWLLDDSIACILLDSSSDRAFCAGADITALYHAIKGDDLSYADAFFTNEYRLDYILHTAKKPIIVWGNGVVMGGGLGLLNGCGSRVGTPDNRIAMPEITIGLFPDAGGTWLLSQMPVGLGVFAGLTGCQLSAGDAVDLNMLDYVIEQQDKQLVLAELAATDWGPLEDDIRKQVARILDTKRVDESALPRNLMTHRDEIKQIVTRSYEAEDFFAEFEKASAEVTGSDWFGGAMDTYRSGSPTTARIFIEQLRRCSSMTLAETFQMELAIACQCVRHPDFPEGVRALLVDKDKNPGWAYQKAGDVPPAYVTGHFEPSWDADHPLADLTSLG